MKTNNYNENDYLEKIVKLEKSYKFLKIIVSILSIMSVSLIFGFFSWFFKSKPQILPITDTILAKSFVLVDDNRKIIGEFSCKKTEEGISYPIIILKNDCGNDCMELYAYKDPKISMRGERPNIEIIGDKASLSLNDSQFSHLKTITLDINSILGGPSINIQTYREIKDKPLYNVFNIHVPNIEIKNKDIISGPVMRLSCDGLRDNWSFITLSVNQEGGNLILKNNNLNLSQTDISVLQGRPSITLYDSMKPFGFLVNRATLGSVDLINENTGIEEKRPPSSLVLFNKEGKVIWKTP
jgi:hypothetical protein